jgi:uncharacterized protein (TIGR04222 family)
MNMLDLRGPEFLQFYVILLGGLAATAAAVRWVLRGPADVRPNVGNIDAFDAAYLAGGPRMAVDAAITSLVHAGRIRVHLGSSLKPNDAGVFGMGRRSSLEEAIFSAIGDGGWTIRRLHSGAAIYTRAIAERLSTAGLAPTAAQSARVRLASAATVLPALLIGAAKIGVGISRNRPVAFLVMLCFLAAVLMLVLLFKPVYRTRAGSRVLAQLRSANSALALSAKTDPDRLANSDLALALALFGPAVLASGELGRLRQALWPPNSSGGHGCGGGSGCGSGSGCGGG